MALRRVSRTSAFLILASGILARRRKHITIRYGLPVEYVTRRFAGLMPGARCAEITLVVMAAAVAMGWSYHNKVLFDHHYLAARDLSFFTQSLWNAAEGNGLRTTIGWTGEHLFGEHVYLSQWLLVPLYKLAPHPYALLFLQSAAVAAASVAGYFVARSLLLRSPSPSRWRRRSWFILQCTISPPAGHQETD